MQKGCPKDPGANRRGNSDEYLHSDWNGFIHLGNSRCAKLNAILAINLVLLSPLQCIVLTT